MAVRGDPPLIAPAREAQVRRAADVLVQSDEGARRLLGLATRLLGVGFGFLTLVDEAEGVFHAVTSPSAQPLPRALPVADSVCQQLVTSGTPLLAEDLAVHPQLSRLEEVQRLGLRSYAGVPLRSAEGLVLGGFCVAHDAPRPWSAADLELLLDLAAAQAAELQLRTALQDVARARRRDQARAAQAEALHRVAVAVARGDAPAAVLALAADELERLPGVQAALVVCGAGDERTVVASSGDVGTGLLERVAELLDGAERTGRGTTGLLQGSHAAVVPLAVQERHWGCVAVLLDAPPTPGQLSRLRDLMGIVVGTTDAQERLLQLARTDPLTGVLNRRGFEEQVAAALERDRRGGGLVTLAALDVDRFKEVNDVRGHAVGDAVLRSLVVRLRPGLRGGDVLGRPGGDEFAVLLPGADAETACRVLERLRTLVAAEPLAGCRLTISVGAATTRAGQTPVEQLGALADRALYAVKDSGRDGVRVVDADADADADTGAGSA